MAQAAILSLEEFRDAQRRSEVRQRVHDRLDAWLDRLAAPVQAPTPTSGKLTQAVLALRQEVTHAITEGLVEQRTAACPQCGQTLSARGPQERTVETLVGAIRLRHPYVDCARCQGGSTPLKTTLGLTERRTPPDVQKAAVQWTTELP